MSQTQLLLTQSDAGVELTREEFLESEFDAQWRYERAEVRLVVMPPPEFGHHVVAMSFRNHLGAYMLAHHDLVEFVFQESHTVIDDDTDRIPDIAVYLKSNRDLPEFPYRVPDLIVEVVSPYAPARFRRNNVGRVEYVRLQQQLLSFAQQYPVAGG